MKYSKKEFGKPVEIDFTPMIDMTFQLIAFFMIILNFSEADQNEAIRLPASQLAKAPDAPPETPITLQLTQDGTLLYGGDVIPLSQFGQYLQREREVLYRTSSSPKKSTIIIRADKDAQTGQVQELIKLCQDNEFEQFVLRAKEDAK